MCLFLPDGGNETAALLAPQSCIRVEWMSRCCPKHNIGLPGLRLIVMAKHRHYKTQVVTESTLW